MSTIKEILEPVLKDHVLLEFDYAQLEIRVLALATGSEQLIDDINSGMDMHTHFASKIFDIPESEVDPAQRKMAKGFSFQLQYGASAKGIANQWGVEEELAEKFIREYFARYPEIAEWHDEIKAFVNDEADFDGAQADMDGVTVPVKSSTIPSIWPFHNKRCGGFHVDEITWRNAKPTDTRYSSFSNTRNKNYPIQGAAADIMLLMIGQLQRQWAGDNDIRLINTVHDSVMISVPVAEAGDYAKSIKEFLECVPDMLYDMFRVRSPVQFPVDVAMGPSWGKLEELTL